MFNIFISAFMQIMNLLTRPMYLPCINVYSDKTLSYRRNRAAGCVRVKSVRVKFVMCKRQFCLVVNFSGTAALVLAKSAD